MSNSNAEHNRTYLQKLVLKLSSLSPEATKKVIYDLIGDDPVKAQWVFIDVLDGLYDNVGHKEES